LINFFGPASLLSPGPNAPNQGPLDALGHDLRSPGDINPDTHQILFQDHAEPNPLLRLYMLHVIFIFLLSTKSFEQIYLLRSMHAFQKVPTEVILGPIPIAK
jgi:hypothetical protein